ncbi:hypothetical protein [Dongshaea marina]|uniref:hypothetical protein n=1 Tax=Dongshaea marina TaxID=2047966 RepID=UPI001F394CFD|nr:hypothetical protein [Dongshaea marina]
MKTKLLTCALLGAGLLSHGALAQESYSLESGYGTFNVKLSAEQPIQSVTFDYGQANYQPGYISSGYSVSHGTDIGHGMYQYKITFQSSDPWTKPVDSLSLGQVPYFTGSQIKNAPFSEFYGIPSNIKINGKDAQLTTPPFGITKLTLPDTQKMIGAYYADWSVYGDMIITHSTRSPSTTSIPSSMDLAQSIQPQGSPDPRSLCRYPEKNRWCGRLSLPDGTTHHQPQAQCHLLIRRLGHSQDLPVWRLKQL